MSIYETTVRCKIRAYNSRACAVKGGTYVLGAQAEIESMSLDEDANTDSPISIKLQCHPRPISAKRVISTRDHLPPPLLPTSSTVKRKRITAHCVAVLSALPALLRRSEAEDVEKANEDDTAVILFPPEGDAGLVRGLLMGEGTGSCPAGQCELLPVLFLVYQVKLIDSHLISQFRRPR